MTDDHNDEPRSRRQIRREAQRDVGERSAKLAATLMKMSQVELAKLQLDEDTQDAVVTARAI